ncbi:MAG: hypothetical protein V4524_01675 [Patescibacteria group bacterium]
MNEENQNPSLAPQDFPVQTGQDIGPTSNSPEPAHPPHVTETPQKALRTYESDVADVLAHKKISTATIALAEQKKSTGQNNLGESAESIEYKADHTQTVKKTLIALAGIILIGGGIGGAYYFYSISPLATSGTKTQVQAPVPTSIVPVDSRITISTDSMSPTAIINAIRDEIAKPQADDTIKEIILVKSTDGQRFRVSGPTIASTMDITAPDVLLRALANNWMLGVYADKQGNKDVFIIATVDYFQNAFSGMLQWENVMADDLKQYFYKDASLYTVVHGSFTDRILRNKDVREFITNDTVLFLYSFIDNSKLIITGSESTLGAVLDRLEQKAFVR